MQANNKLHTTHTHSQTLRTNAHTHIVRFKNMRGGNVFRWWERFLSYTCQGQQKCQGPVIRRDQTVKYTQGVNAKGVFAENIVLIAGMRTSPLVLNVYQCVTFTSCSQCTTLPHTCPLIRTRLQASKMR
jgi:hypothetical protein